MRILLWHGYLLGGTGSNVYTRMLAREWSNAGHDVTVLSQEPHPERFDLGSATSVRPDVGGLLPVFVLDRYEGYDVRRVQDCSRAELDAWVEANAAAIRALLPADVVFTNHVLLGGPVGAATGAPFAVKAHGSELEYSMRGNPELSAWGAEALAAARATFVGSDHIRTVLREVCGHTDNVLEVPPGVDIDEWVPEPRDVALAALLEEARRDRPNPGNAEERLPDEGNAARLERFLAPGEPVVVYFGKLIEQKGVHVLIEALAGLDARLVVVGFGPERAALEALAADRGVEALFTGPLEHRHLGTCSRSRTPASCRRSSPRRSAWSRPRPPPPAVRRSSPGTRASPRSRPGSRRRIRAELRHLAAFDTGDARGSRPAAGRAARAVAARPRRRSGLLPAPPWSSAGAGRASRAACSSRSPEVAAASRYRKCSIDYAFTLHGRRAARSDRSASPRRP